MSAAAGMPPQAEASNSGNVTAEDGSAITIANRATIVSNQPGSKYTYASTYDVSSESIYATGNGSTIDITNEAR